MQTKKLIEEYFNKREGFAISIKALDSLIGNGDDFYSETKDDDRIFICECIDCLKPITPQLNKIKNNLNKYKIIGIKIYLGYQPIFANDKKLFEVYDFAKKQGLSVVFHCGVGAENLKSEKNINYASCVPVGEIAKLYPETNFIVSHFDYPHLDDCLNVILNNKNVFTDISGEYENFNNLDYSILMKDFITKLNNAMSKYDKSQIAQKVMFGTDYFGIGSGFEAVEEYIETAKILFGEQNLENILFNNVLKAYPALQKYLFLDNYVDKDYE